LSGGLTGMPSAGLCAETLMRVPAACRQLHTRPAAGLATAVTGGKEAALDPGIAESTQSAESVQRPRLQARRTSTRLQAWLQRLHPEQTLSGLACDTVARPRSTPPHSGLGDEGARLLVWMHETCDPVLQLRQRLRQQLDDALRKRAARQAGGRAGPESTALSVAAAASSVMQRPHSPLAGDSSGPGPLPVMHADSVMRKRRTKMKRHKWKKRQRSLRRKSKASQGAA
jgi:Mitochondrial domain of unknown function (DUF1713)